METEKKEEKTFKDMLLNYREYDAKIKFYKKLVAEEKAKQYSIGGGLGDGQPGTPQKSFKNNTAEDQVIRKVDNLKHYESQIDLLQAEKDLLESVVNTLSDTHKKYIESRFYNGYSIEQVSEQFNIDKKSMANTLQSILDKLENKYRNLVKSW